MFNKTLCQKNHNLIFGRITMNRMNKFIKVDALKTLATSTLFITALSASSIANAATITDTVIVGDKEWAQVDLFNGATWNTFNAQCPSGVCGASSTFNSLSLNGWTWATQADVGDFLFAPLTAHPGGSSNLFEEPIDNLTPWITATGFNLTRDSAFGVSTFFFVNREVYGLTSGTAGEVAYASYELVLNSGSTNSSRTRFDTAAAAIGADEVAQFNGGAWLYRDVATVPVPAAAWLFGSALLGLGAISRRRS